MQLYGKYGKGKQVVRHGRVRHHTPELDGVPRATGASGKQGGTAEKVVPEAEASGIFYSHRSSNNDPKRF
jgi:hypothetical protein